MLHRVARVRTNVSEERIDSIIWVTRIGELGTTLTVTSAARVGYYLLLTLFLARRFLSP
jgi:hypothetical protein